MRLVGLSDLVAVISVSVFFSMMSLKSETSRNTTLDSQDTGEVAMITH
jgi:hypothetical protein